MEVARVELDFWVTRVVLLVETATAEEEALLVATTAVEEALLDVAATFEEEATGVEVATATFEEVVIAPWDAEAVTEDPPPLAMRAETGVLPGKKEVGTVGIGMLAVKAKGVAKSWAMVEAS